MWYTEVVSYSLSVCRNIAKRLDFIDFRSDLWSWMFCEGVKCLLDVELLDSEMQALLKVCQNGLQIVFSFPKTWGKKKKKGIVKAI